MKTIKRLSIFLILGLVFFLFSCEPRESEIPSHFDLRSLGYVTPVKTQAVIDEYWNNVGLCWAYAAIASFESSMLMQGIVTNPHLREANLSPWHIGNHIGHNHPNLSFNQTAFGNPPVPVGYALDETLQYGWGGSVLFAVEWLSQGYGFVFDEDAPLPLEDMYNRVDLTPPLRDLNMHYMLRSALIYERYKYDSDEAYRNTLKKAIMNYGAAASPMYLTIGDVPGQSGLTYYRDDYYIDYYVDDPNLENHLVHMVTIVGWDDDYQIQGAPNQGAWIIKDSMGSYLHDQGYMMIAYDDTVFLKGYSYAVILVADDGLNYRVERYQSNQGILSYPVRPETMFLSTGFNDLQVESWGSAKFSATDDHFLKAIGLATKNHNEQVKIMVHQGFGINGEPVHMMHEETFLIKEQGYHVVDLKELVALTKDVDFYITIGFTYKASREEPLVYVMNPLNSNLNHTWIASKDHEGRFHWVNTHQVIENSVFYIQGIIQKN